MDGRAIVERIISDAEESARAIIAEAEQKAAQVISEANTMAQRNRQGTEAEVAEKVKGIYDGKSASARLDGAKILLGEKRGVIDEIYSRALKQLIALNRTDSLYLAEKLLRKHAEDGDEIAFADNYSCAQDVMKLDVVKEKNLKKSGKPADVDGGFVLIGKNSDKNLSCGALVAQDREEYQAEIASKIFITG